MLVIPIDIYEPLLSTYKSVQGFTTKEQFEVGYTGRQ